VLKDPALEARARAISAGLRCLVCQNQSIDDSDAPLARDLRLIVRERLLAGDSDEAVRAFVVARYGDFVLLRPPLRLSTLLLWLAPLVVLAGAVAFIWRRTRQGAIATAEAPPLRPEERAQLACLLKKDPS
jgi:cytochrome c-type biogenesis protein CcmH